MYYGLIRTTQALFRSEMAIVLAQCLPYMYSGHSALIMDIVAHTSAAAGPRSSFLEIVCRKYPTGRSHAYP